MTLKEKFKRAFNKASETNRSSAFSKYDMAGSLILGVAVLPFSVPWGLFVLAMPTMHFGLSIAQKGIANAIPKPKKRKDPQPR